MKKLRTLISAIIDRVNVNLRNPFVDLAPMVEGVVPLDWFAGSDARYAMAFGHPLFYHFSSSALAGTSFMGRCIVDHSVLYRCNVRGEGLRSRNDAFSYRGSQVPLDHDEVIRINDSYLIRTLVHGHSSDPERPEELQVRNTLSLPYAGIESSHVQGSLLLPFSTVEMTALHDCVIGPYAYVQAEALRHRSIDEGVVSIQSEGGFDFTYRFPAEVVRRYIRMEAGGSPQGIFVDFAAERERELQEGSCGSDRDRRGDIPSGAYLSRCAALRGEVAVSADSFTGEGAYLRDARLEQRAQARENCSVIHSALGERSIAAQGSRIIHARLGKNTFVGPNSFLRGLADFPLSVGSGCLFAPHTIVDLEAPLAIPANTVVWGYIRNEQDLASNSMPIEDFSRIEKSAAVGLMRFEGSGARFIDSFRERIDQIVKLGACQADPGANDPQGAARARGSVSFHVIQPYPLGEYKGLCPTMEIAPCEPREPSAASIRRGGKFGAVTPRPERFERFWRGC